MIEIERVAFPLAEVFTISRGSKTKAEVVTVKISRQGITGWGESVPYGRYGESLDSVSAQIHDLPADIDRLTLQEVMPAGAARNAVDCALWDLEAKRTGLRVWDLLGMAEPTTVTTAFTLSLASPTEMELAARKAAARPILKIKLGTPDDMARLEAVRRGAPRAKLIIDANEGWSVDAYRELAPHLKALGVILVEQPLPAGQDEALSEIERLVPICADESVHDRKSLRELQGRYDMVNIKLDKTGGLTEAFAMAKEARSLGFGLMTGCMVGSSLAMAPAILIASLSDIVDLDGPLLLAEDRAYPLRYDLSQLHPPERALWG